MMNTRYFDILFLFRIIKLRKVFSRIQDFFQISDSLQSGIIDLIKLLVFIIFIAHFSACIWLYVVVIQTYFDKNDNTTWIVVNNFANESRFTQYVAALYYSAMTQITAGMVNVTNPTEKLIGVVVMIIQAGCYAYSVGSIGNIVVTMTANNVELRQKLSDINHYMKRRNISKEIQVATRKYIEYMHQEEKFGSQRGEYLFETLSRHLQAVLTQDCYSKIVSKMTILQTYFSKPFLEKLCIAFEEMTYAPDELIFAVSISAFIFCRKETKKKSFTILQAEKQNFIQKGHSLIIRKDLPIKLFKFLNQLNKQFNQEGETFGQVSFFTSKPRESFAKSLKVTHLAQIKQEKFLEIITEFPKDYVIQIYKLNSRKCIV